MIIDERVQLIVLCLLVSPDILTNKCIFHNASKPVWNSCCSANIILCTHVIQWRFQDFPLGRGPVNLQRGCFSMKMYAKLKELVPIGSVHQKCLCVDPPLWLNYVRTVKWLTSNNRIRVSDLPLSRCLFIMWPVSQYRQMQSGDYLYLK